MSIGSGYPSHQNIQKKWAFLSFVSEFERDWMIVVSPADILIWYIVFQGTPSCSC